MLKTTKNGVTYAYPLDRKSKIKCEGYVGVYTIIDATIYEGHVYVLLEHDWYGDETSLLLAVLEPDYFRWYVVETSSGKQKKQFFIASRDIIGETFDSIDIAMNDYLDNVVELDDIEFWTDEEIDKTAED